MLSLKSKRENVLGWLLTSTAAAVLTNGARLLELASRPEPEPWEETGEESEQDLEEKAS
jgi:hypothetical protein